MPALPHLDLASLGQAATWLALSLLSALFVYGFHPIQRWRYRHIPGPRPMWLLGNLPEIIRKTQPLAYQEWERQYGPTFKVFFGGLCAIVVSDPVNARKAARGSAWRSGIVSLHVGKEREFDDHAIIMSRGDAWRATHNAWHPFFSRESVAGYATFMAESADRLVAALERHAASGQQVDIWRQCGRMALDVVGSTAFGVNFRTLEQAPDSISPALSSSGALTTGASGELAPETPTSPDAGIAPAARLAQVGDGAKAEALIGAVRAIFDGFDLTNVWMGVAVLFPHAMLLVSHLANLFPTSKFKQLLKARVLLREVAGELLSDFRASTAAANGSGLGDTRGGKGVDPGSFMALMTRAIDPRTKASFSEPWVIQQAVIFIGGGYETTANALAACVYLLATHPEKEAKLLAEVDRFGRDRTPAAEDLGAFPFAEGVWKEALRLLPPATLLGRELQRDMTLAGFQLPKGTVVHANSYTMQRNPAYFPNPEAFLPERFIPGAPEAEGCNLDAYLPFGDGARKCIGYQFATQEGVLTLIRLYQKLVFRLTPGQVPLKMKTGLAYGPKDGVHVTVHRRD